MLAWVRRLIRKTSTAPISSFHTSSLVAKQQILEVDANLLREVLLFLGTDIADCHAALMVNHFWGEVLAR
jgi:hypothetical protein